MTANEARANYMREYRAKNKDRLNEQAKARYRKNPQKYKEANIRYWERKAQEQIEA